MSWYFAPFYDRFMAKTEENCLAEWRAEVLAGVSGDVLEIGAGTGANLPAYPDSVRSVTFCEPDEGMRRQLEARLAAAAPPWDFRVSDAPAEELAFDESAFDSVVATLVLCTVADLDRTIRELRRVARPGGQFHFLEHVAAEHGSMRRRWQGWVEPVWKRLAGNCHLTRDTEQAIAQYFTIDDIKRESMRKAVPLIRPTIRGVAS